jgi:diadenosine tetraphosphate (Ap4A) HIT family hydrolase
MCADGRPEETRDGAIRFFEGRNVDGYLTDGQNRGSSLVIWRGRHVADPTELDSTEAAEFWRDLLKVGRAVEARYSPVKLNFYILSNTVPHLHCMLLPRYENDPGAGGFLRYARAATRTDCSELQREADALKELVS